MRTFVKICGLSTPDTLDAALQAGADLVGFVRFAKSPRHVALNRGAALSAQAKGRATRVVLAVDPDDAELEEIVRAFAPDMLQLHGKESPERVEEIRNRYGLPIIKAIAVDGPGDLVTIARYRAFARWLLLDAKPPKGATLPGGNGVPFDWNLIHAIGADPAIMLSGGLTPETVATAIRMTGVTAVDVSSGVESAPGVKDNEKIRSFIAAVRCS